MLVFRCFIVIYGGIISLFWEERTFLKRYLMTEKEQRIVDKIHDKEFEMLCKLDEACRKYNITYYLEAGTLIGAVRHHDFVPWDDDIDIYFKRKDFEKFLQHSDDLAPYFINVPKPEDGYFWDFTARVINPNVTLKKDGREARFYNHTNCQHLFIDLFVMDSHPGGLKGKLQKLELILIYILSMSRRYKMKFDAPSNPIVRFGMFVLSRMGKLMSFKWLFKRYDKVSRKYNGRGNSCEYYLLTNAAATFIPSSVYRKEWYKTRTELPVRDKKFYVPGNYKESLRNYYGDFMQLPPEEDRFPDHIKSINEVIIDGVPAKDL